MMFFSAFQQTYLWLPLIGFVVGMLATMIGTGGGFFFPLILILFFNTPGHIAVGTSLAATLPLCIVGTVGYYRSGNIHIRIALIFGIAGIFGALAGAAFTQLMNTNHLKMAFGVYSILMAGLIFWNSRKKKHASPNEEQNPDGMVQKKKYKGTFYGFMGGIISGTFGTSGAAPVLAGLMALHTPIRLVAGTSLFVVLINTFSALAGHVFIGEIDLTLVVFLTSGTILGAFLGPRLLSHVKLEKRETPIRKIFAFVMLIFGIILILT
jgi:hypothetical protein